MQLISRRSKALIVAGACGLLTGLGGCGDDNGNNENSDAAVNPDGTPDEADAMLDPDDLRSGTIAVLDLAITNPDVQYSGAVVSINYTDLTAGDVEPAYGQASPLPGQCSVKIYNVGTDQAPTTVDEGAVTIEGALSPIGTCSFDTATKGYRCPAGSGAVGVNSTVSPGPSGTMLIAFPVDTSFADMDLIGTYVQIEGLTNDAYNGWFPVVNIPLENQLLVANPAATGQTPEVVGEGAAPTYAFYAGAGPTPVNRDFLGDDATTLTVSKAAGSVVTSFTTMLIPSGEGLQLADTSALVHDLPATAQDVIFTCDAAGNGACGPAGGLVSGFVVSGETTDASLDAAGPTDMPEAQSKRATFLCVGNPGTDSIQIPSGAMDVILSTSPTRIRTQLMRITADQNSPQTSIVVGHALVGFTDLIQ